MKGKMIVLSAVASAGALGLSVPANGAITFLDHFNGQTGFTLSPGNGDYAGGSGTATPTGTHLGTGTGYFGSPDQAFQVANNTGSGVDEYLGFAGAGNIDYTSGTSGGVTVGAWLKLSGSGNVRTNVVTLGPVSGDDRFVVDYGEGATSTPRLVYVDYSTAPVYASDISGSPISASDWIYLAGTVDLTSGTMSLYTFDATGAMQSSVATALPANYDWGVKAAGLVEIGGAEGNANTTTWIDEVSIDNQVLTQAQIQARVTSMVNGNPLSVPEPASVALLGLGALSLIRRRRK